jgi:hypothetical protein
LAGAVDAAQYYPNIADNLLQGCRYRLPLSAFGLHALHDALTHSAEELPNHVDFLPPQLASAVKRSDIDVFYRYRIKDVYESRVVVKQLVENHQS